MSQSAIITRIRLIWPGSYLIRTKKKALKEILIPKKDYESI